MKNLIKFHNSTILSGCIVFLMITGFILSCTRDDVKPGMTAPLTNLEKRTVESCEPKDEDQNPCMKILPTWVVQLPLFDSCFFGIETEVYNCGNSILYFGNFKIILEDCDSFDIWLNNCQSSGGAFASCMALLNDQIMEAVAIKKVTGINPSSSTVAVYFYGAACNQYCLYEQFDPREEIYYFTFDKLRCSDACCIKEYELTKIEGKWVVTDTDVSQYGGIGCEYILQVETCESGAIYTTNCIHECE